MSIRDPAGKYVTVKLRPEDELLLCCARTDVNLEVEDKILSLIQSNLDWNYLLKLASRHRLMALLYHNLNSICPELVPEDILKELKDNFNVNVHQNLLLTGELIKILNKLDSYGINAIPYKGSSLAIFAYNNLALRQFGDIDIVVDKSDTPKVKDLMFSFGYEFESYPWNMDEFLYFKTQTEHKFIDKKRDIVVEIHNKFQGHFFYFPINSEFLYKRENLKMLNINNYQVSIPSTENLILILCVHCSRHNWSRISWICDISEIIQNQNINWSELIETAEKLCIKRILLINLFLASDLLGLELNDEILTHINKDYQVENISIEIKKRLFIMSNNSLNIIERISLDIKKRESLRISFLDVLISMMKPTYEDFKDLPLPSFLFYLYYLIRPILLFNRYNKGII